MIDMCRAGAVSWDAEIGRPVRMDLVTEEPLAIRIEGRPYSVIMRTPGDEQAHAAGFCLGEGIVDHPSDFRSIGLCNGDDSTAFSVPSGADQMEFSSPDDGWLF